MDELEINLYLNTVWEKVLPDKANKKIADSLFSGIIKDLSHPDRFYHNSRHIFNIVKQVLELNTDFASNLIFTAFYHDVIYNASSGKNEVNSAERAEIELRQMGIEEESIKWIKGTIISTANHLDYSGKDPNTMLFLDMDLSILGSDRKTYLAYISNIRREYKIYPDMIYKAGRRKFVKTLLSKDHLFFTSNYRTSYEEPAFQNLRAELELLK